LKVLNLASNTVKHLA